MLNQRIRVKDEDKRRRPMVEACLSWSVLPQTGTQMQMHEICPVGESVGP